jgi:hypothetical protein
MGSVVIGSPADTSIVALAAAHKNPNILLLIIRLPLFDFFQH